MPDAARHHHFREQPASQHAIRNSGVAMRAFRWFAIACLAALAGCGVPGEPLPPLLELPEPVRDLRAEQVGSRLEIIFSPPQLTTEGTLIRHLNRIEIYGAFLPPNAPAAESTDQWRLLAVLPAPMPPPGAPVRYALPLQPAQRGTRAVIAVKAINHREKDAGFSNQAIAEIADLPEPPEELQATLTEAAIRLRWRPAAGSAFGGAAPSPDGYEVYRSDAGDFGPLQLLATAATPFFDDTSFTFGRRYRYAVRAFVRRGDSVARTPESASVEIAAEDRFPPAAPRNLRAIAVAGAVELAWSPNTEPDLAGYHLYRSEGGAYRRLNAEPLRLPLFRDVALRPGMEVRYRVTAVDQNGNESPPSEAVPVVAE